jgi:hypothetical protein
MAGDGDDVCGAEDGGLVEDAAADFSEGEAVLGGVVALEAASLLDGLKGDATHAGLGERVLEDGTEFMVVDAALDGDDECGGDAEAVEDGEGALADMAEVGTAELEEGVAGERVELEVELEAGHVGGELLGEAWLSGDADAVGVDHEVADGAFATHVEDAKEVGVEGGLAAGELDDVGLELVGNDAVEHGLNLREGAVGGAMGATGGVADGAGEVAVVGDFEEGEAGVLLMVGAEAAVVGAAVADRGVVAGGHFGRLEEDFATTAVVGDVVGDEDALKAVGGAALEEVDVVVLKDDFGVDALVAGGAEGDGSVVEEVVAGGGGHERSILGGSSLLLWPGELLKSFFRTIRRRTMISAAALRRMAASSTKPVMITTWVRRVFEEIPAQENAAFNPQRPVAMVSTVHRIATARIRPVLSVQGAFIVGFPAR